MRQLIKTKHFLFGFSFLLFVYSGCEKEKETDLPPDDNNPAVVTKSYSGSGSEGDLVTVAINQTNKTYTVHNETTGNNDNGSYEIKSGTFSKIYEVSAGGNTFFAVELSGKVLAANFPTGNALNDISFGVSSSLSYLNNSSVITGDYTWIIMSGKEIDGSTANKEWGVMTVKNDGTWLKKNYKGGSGHSSNPGYLSPISFAETLPLTSGDETGTWEVNGTHQERLNVTINGVSGTLTGFVYGDANTAAFLLDLGPGDGFMLGVKNTNSTTSTIAGNYSFVDVWRTGKKGAGNYSIAANGSISYNHITTDGLLDSGSFTINQCAVLKNVFYCDNAMVGGFTISAYCIVCGDIILNFFFSNADGAFIAYGAGGKL